MSRRRNHIPGELLWLLALVAVVALLFVTAGNGLIHPWRA